MSSPPKRRLPSLPRPLVAFDRVFEQHNSSEALSSLRSAGSSIISFDFENDNEYQADDEEDQESGLKSTKSRRGMQHSKSYSYNLDRRTPQYPFKSRAKTPGTFKSAMFPGPDLNITYRKIMNLSESRSNVNVSSPLSDLNLLNNIHQNANINDQNSGKQQQQQQKNVDRIAPFNAIEIASITIIILLIISLFLYHCQKASSKTDKNNNTENQTKKEFKRRKLRRRHSISKSSNSFMSNLESVREEPEIFTHTRLADTMQRAEDEEENEGESWYKWINKDSPVNLVNKSQSENDLSISMEDHQHEKHTFFITIPGVKKDEIVLKENGRQRSFSFDSYF